MQKVPKIVVKRLQSAAAELHPDADLLTAFAEQSLAGPEREHVVEHLAHCGDCREVVSIALPPQVEPQPLADITSDWFRWPVLRWAAVAAGVVLVASLGTLQYRAQHAKQLASNAFDYKTVIATPEQRPQGSSQPDLSQSLVQADVAAPRAQAEVTKAKPQLSDGSRLKPESRPAQKKAEAQAEAEQVTAPSSAENQVQDQIARNEPAEPSQADRVAKAKPASTQAAPSTLAPAPSLHSDPIVMKRLAVPRWIIGATGTLQRSLDGGKTWLEVNPASAESTSANLMHAEKTGTTTEPAPVIFRSLSVSSNAAEVWAGGSGGALYHSTDSGKNWIRVVPSASGITVTGDITSVQFSDPRNGTVATSTAEIWITPDDGETWHKQ